ncbi:MAG: DUF4335 domain-containing protein [Cyanobacteria bacterium P01_F01_bin.150]
MTIQRQYNRPNCKLVLEGPADSNGAIADKENPLISAVTSVECHFAGYDTPLTGGQELLDGLVYAVSQYVQEVLSGITRPEASKTKSVARVQLQPLGEDLHRLTVNQAASESDPSKYQVDLKTIQLFDLVETVDQLVADDQTLPALGVDLSPLPRRYVATQEPVADKLLPAALGVSSLAVAAIALFLLPVPKINPPEIEPRPVTEELAPGLESDGTTPNTSGTGDDPPVTEEEEIDAGDAGSDASSGSSITPGQTASASNANDVTSASGQARDSGNIVSAATDSEANAVIIDDERDATVDSAPKAVLSEQPDAAEIDKILGTAQPIADPDQLDTLTLQLRNRIDQAWKRPEDLADDLIYRVGVTESGDMVGFKPVNELATKWVDTIPLSDFDTVPVSAANSFQTSVGQFRVVFRTTGVVEVSPWYGRLPEDE